MYYLLEKFNKDFRGALDLSYKDLIFNISAGVIFLVAFSFFYVNVLMNTEGQHFLVLAQSFLQGKLYFLFDPYKNWVDTALVFGHYYFPLGPLPAALLVPFAWFFSLFNPPFYQGYMQLYIVLAILYFIFKLARISKFSQYDSFFIMTAFFTSSFLHIAMFPAYSYFAHVVVVGLSLAIILEYLSSKRYWVIGLLIGFLLLTRITAGLSIVFFVIDILLNKDVDPQKKYKALFKLLLPFFLGILLLSLYNYLRFNDFLETGYSFQRVIEYSLFKAREYGLFSLIHLPGNLYYLLLATPEPVFRDGFSHVLVYPFVKLNPWGMSIFITSPYLLYLFKFKYKNIVSQLLLLTIFVIAIPVLLYYGIGFYQFGYRYAFDFIPFLFFLFIREYNDKYGKLSYGIKFLILISAMFNLYLIATT
jgi:hypothetical protein